MQKLKLSLDDLQVESFRTVPDAAGEAGTVRGNVAAGDAEIVDTDMITIVKSCYGTHCDPSCNNRTCIASCNGSCATCNGTCNDPTCFASSPHVCC